MNKIATFSIGAVVGGVVVLVAIVVLGVIGKNTQVQSEIQNRERLLGISCNDAAIRGRQVVENHTSEIARAVRSNKYEEGAAVRLAIESGAEIALQADISALLRASRECEKLQNYARSRNVKFEGDFRKLSEALYTLDILMISPLGTQSPERRALWQKMASQAEDTRRDLTSGAADPPPTGR